MAHVLLELVQVLMGDGKADPVLAKFREHICHSEGSEVLELVDVDEEVSPLGRRYIGPAECCQAEGRDEEAAQERRTVLANPPLGQVDQEHLPLCHDLSDVEVVFGGGQYAVEKGVRQEGPDLVLDWRRSVGPIAEGEAVVLL